MGTEAIVQVKDLSIGFTVDNHYIEAVDAISFEIREGESLGLVGESGCGKSVTAMSLLRLLPIPIATVKSEALLFDGKSIPALSPKEIYAIRGQEPMTSLNPVKRIGAQVEETLLIHHPELGNAEIYRRTLQMLKEVGLPEPEEIYRQYPHNLSGGMRQRVVIAIAMINRPKLLIADEPTTALDVTIQAQIINLIKDLKNQYRMSLLLITHNMGLVTTLCDRIIVMYAGRFAEVALVADLFKTPLHPYTQGLLKSIPSLVDVGQELSSIPGTVPHPSRFLKGCRFAPRCPFVFAKCREDTPPPLFEKAHSQRVSCWLYEGQNR
jgi:peptide/nickel transport system ATP-binding protein